MFADTKVERNFCRDGEMPIRIFSSSFRISNLFFRVRFWLSKVLDIRPFTLPYKSGSIASPGLTCPFTLCCLFQLKSHITKMAEAAQERVQSSMTSMVDDIDKSYLRKMQVRMLQCYTKDVPACWYID